MYLFLSILILNITIWLKAQYSTIFLLLFLINYLYFITHFYFTNKIHLVENYKSKSYYKLKVYRDILIIVIGLYLYIIDELKQLKLFVIFSICLYSILTVINISKIYFNKSFELLFLKNALESRRLCLSGSLTLFFLSGLLVIKDDYKGMYFLKNGEIFFFPISLMLFLLGVALFLKFNKLKN